jgi:hypothetical protein
VSRGRSPQESLLVEGRSLSAHSGARRPVL